LAHPNAWTRHHTLSVVELQPDWAICIEKVNPVVNHGNSQGRAEISWTTCQRDAADHLAAPGLGDFDAVVDSGGTQ
jgi:hypothetical protein